jgi:hypothetical protein
MMHFGEVQPVQTGTGHGQGALPGRDAAGECGGIALFHGHEVIGVAESCEPDRCSGRRRRRGAGCEHEGGGAVGDGGAVGAAQRVGDHRVLVRDGPAELFAEILAQLGVGI